MPRRTHAAIERIQIFYALAKGSFSFDEYHLGLNRADHTLRDLVLDSEDVGHVAIEPLGPQIIASFRFDQLACNPHALTGSSCRVERLANWAPLNRLL